MQTQIQNVPFQQLPASGAFTTDQFKVGLVPCDSVNGNVTLATGDDTILAFNPDVVAHNLIVTSFADPQGRFSTVVYPLPAGELQAIRILPSAYYTEPGTNFIHFGADNALIKVAAISNLSHIVG